MDTSRKSVIRVISVLMALLLAVNVALPAMAVMMDTPNATGMTLTDGDGNTVTVDESWEEAFPYGTFAFQNSQMSTSEGAGTQTIKVYRLGGTKGKAQIALSLTPAVSQLDDGTYSFANAAGSNDYDIEVEDSLPITDYQAYGYDAPPLAPDPAVTVSVAEDESTENTTDEDGETVYGHTVLTADVSAASYQWQALGEAGWEDVEGAGRTLDVDNQAMEVSDFRCVYTIDGVKYCTTSLNGTAYVAEDNSEKDIPSDLDRNPPQSFHKLDLADGEYDTYQFYMTFAEGEWVKEIRITPRDDSASENVELVALKIDSCKGGELYDAANTLLVSVEDNDAVLPSYFAFEKSALTVDKASGTASLKVKRTGALQYVATVDYHTVDGTAKAGTDYSSVSGTLYFASDMSEMTIEVPLINDGVVIEEADKAFTIVLDNPKGGGKDTAITQGTATVSLYNTAQAVDPNLATMLYTPEADDVSASTETTQHAIAEPSGEVVSATPVDPGADAKVDVSFGGEGEVGALTYDASGLLSLSRSSLPTSRYWDDYADLGGMGNYSYTNDTQGLAYQGWDDTNQVKKDSEGYMGRYVEDITGDNNRYSRWNTQTFANFDQQFGHVYGLYHASTHWNWLSTFWSTATAGIAPIDKGYPQEWLRSTAGWVKNWPLDFTVDAGATGLFISLGIRDKGWADTGSPNGEVYQKARAQRRYLTQPLRYKVHTADDDTITAAQKTALYSGIAPSITVPAGKGGVYAANKAYIGTELSLGKPTTATYSYATQNVSNGKAVYLSSSGGSVIKTGSVASDGTASLQILGENGKTFATGSQNTLNLSDQYTVNVVLNRAQKIAIDMGPSMPRAEDGKNITSDTAKIQAALDAFWNTSNITINRADPAASGDGTFNAATSSLKSGNVSKNGMVLTSSGTYNNIRSINFHLPAEDQILFNGVQYDGNADIPIPISMFGMGTLAFTYYNKDYVSVESNMSMVVTRVEHYVDMNRNGRLDGALDDTNTFVLDAVNGTKDVLVDTLTQEEYAIGNFTPLRDGNGNVIQQFFKFYYNMTPRCLTVPSGAGATDRAQVLPAFVTSVTDASQKAALSAEMQGYRFITSGQYSKTSYVRNGNGQVTDTKTVGTWTGDNKLMYQAAANATETVDIPLGGDYNPVPATYIYQNSAGQTTSADAPMSAADQASGGWSLSDIAFKRVNWNPDYRGNMLYRFSDPEPVFVSDSLVGENLPVAYIVAKAGESGAVRDRYDVSQLNGYLGSFNPLDTVSLCLRPQEGRTTNIIQGWFSTDSLSVLDVIQSGEYSVEVDSATFAGFKSIPDASGLRRTTGTDDGSKQSADSGSSSNSMSEFNVDLGIELPSLSFGLTDYVTLIMDGSEFGFSIGIPVFKAEKSKKAYTASDEAYGTTKPAYGAWEKSGPVEENKGNLTKVKDAFANPSKLLRGDDWKAAKDAVDTALDSDKLVRSKSFEFSVAVNVTVMFKYSAPDHTYYFSSAMVFLQFGFQFKQTMRLTVCPIVYAYFVVGASLELAGGVINDREVVENKNAAIDIKQVYGVGEGSGYESGKIVRTAANLSTGSTSGWEKQSDDAAEGKDVMAGTKGDAFTFISKSDAVNLYFSGKVKVELKQDGAWKNLGYVASDGSDPVFVMFDEKVDGTADQEVRITVLDDDANIDRIVPISGVHNDTYFSGINITPSIFLEVGAGIGVEVLKVEIYFKASISCNMAFATRPNNAGTKGSQLRDPSSSSLSVAGVSNLVTTQDDDEDKTKAFTFNSMTFRAGIGVRVVLLLFNFELDAIQFGIDYSRGQDKSVTKKPATDGFHDNGWKFAWYVLNGSNDVASYDLNDVDDSDGFPGVKITLPSNRFAAQQIYGPDEADMALDEINAMAFDPENLPSKEFQISGYSSSGDAFRLADKLATGTDYKLLTVGGDNYVLYTISRKNPENDIDSNMLVLSRIKNTGETVGLVNPSDEEDATPYIVVDGDGSGDLDFTASAAGDTINASWVSYVAATGADGATTSAPLPGSGVPRPRYDDGGTAVYMDATNYGDSRFEPGEPANAVSEPTETLAEVSEPSVAEVTAQPDRKDYYLTAGEYAGLTTEEQSAYAQDDTETSYYYAKAQGGSYAAASQAYEDAADAYDAWYAYRRYVANAQAWEDYNDYIASDEAQAYAAAQAAYDAWHAYYDAEKTTADTTQGQLAAAAKNTVVKHASFTVGDAAFTAPAIVSGGTGSYMFLPAVSNDGKLTFYARTNNYSAEEKTAATQKAKDYYDASRGDVSTDADGVSTGGGDPTAGFRYAYTTSMDDVYGKNTQFMFSYPDPTKSDGTLIHTGFTPEGWDTAGMRLDRLSMTMLDDTSFYLAYTASQTVTQTSGDSYGDRTVHKLYLQRGSVDPATGAVTLETAKMLRQLVDINDMGMGDALTSGLSLLTGGEASTADGVYANDGTGARQIEAFEDPYFGNVRFLRGNLGSLTGTEENFGESLQFTASGADTSLFMVFEMNGMTYVVPQDSLGSITASGTGAVIPFFTASEDNRTRGNVAIGTDGEGNIAAVYTDTVKNTTNNAIYVSKYDPATATFGEGRMLAMNYMQVYEDSIAGGWSEEDTERAYYGKLDGYQNGGMSSFTFSNLAVAVGLTATADAGSVALNGSTDQAQSGDNVTASGGSEEAGTQSVQRSTLVILAQGTQTALEEKEYLDSGENTKVILPKYDGDGSIESTTGYYALSFGVGEKNIGEGKILFSESNFTPGAILRPVIQFKNTGDVPLRGSATEPVTLQLWISGRPDSGGTVGAGEKLAEWTIADDVAVGQTVNTGLTGDFYTNALPDALEGRKFYFTVSETGRDADHPNGVDDPIVYSSLASKGGYTKTIEAAPELAVENLRFSTVGVEGNKVKLAVSMDVTNRGTADSDAPYLQFAYQSGRTMEDVQEGDTDYQQAVYSALDIRSGVFEISNQTPIETFSDADDRQNGILQLVGADGADLKQGYSRTVTGTFLVSKDMYCEATATGSLNLKVTVFDSNATVGSLSGTGVQTSDFDNEYNGTDNTGYQELEPMSFFSAPVKVSIPLSTTMRLSLPVATTNEGNPVVTVSELNSQALETTEKHMGVLYYNMGTDGTGKNGFLVMSPSSEGSGIIRVSDVATNTWTDIAYTVTESGTGVNIFKDNDIFTWYNASGQKLDPDTDTSGVWMFQQNVMSWGSAGATGVPYLGDLSRTSTKGASFTFSTLAEKLDLYFDGTVTVSSDFPGFATRSYTAAGGDGTGSYATIGLGANADNAAHTVTVKVASDTAAFDRMVETFSKNQDILPDTDSEAPQIYFSRILPETASLNPADYASGDGFQLTAYLLDASGLAQPAFSGGTSNATTKNAAAGSETFRQFDIFVKQNGTFTIQASDTAGNVTTRTITVDWFNSPVTAADSPVPLDVSLQYRDANGNPLAGVGDSDQLSRGQYAYAQVATDADAAITVQYYSAATTTTTTSYALEETGGVYELVKTVTKYDSIGQQAGEPEVTRTAATADTPVPKTSTATSTRGEWKDVPANADEANVFAVAQNAVYKVTARSDGKGTSSTRLFLMSRLNTDLPRIETSHVTAQDTGDAIGYIVRKGVSSQAGIQSVAINGCNVFTASGTAPNGVSDSLPISFGGAYVFTARDTAGNEQTYNMNVAMPIRLQSDDAVTVNPSWAQTRDNGSITVNPAELLGGVYDASLSNAAAGQYANAYQFALVADADKYAGDPIDDTAFDAYADALAWQDTTDFTGLTPGGYVLYIRDAADTPDASADGDYFIRALTVADTAITFTATARRSSAEGLRTIAVSATGGSGEYEYFLMQRANANDMLDAAGINAAVAANDALNWKSNDTSAYTFAECAYGWHQVAVRDKNNPDNLYTEMVRMRRPNSTPLVTEAAAGGLTAAQQQQIIQQNQSEDVIVRNGGSVAIIPAGTLMAGDAVADLIAAIPDTPAEPQSANIVQYTDADGNTFIVPWSLLSDGIAIYIAGKPGKYEIVNAKKDFADTAAHWAHNAIDFVTARGLFNGTEENRFSPDLSMSRGMFVTVLGRLAGIDPAKYGAQSFADVASDQWYAPYAEWATRSGILSGYGGGLFGPDDEITREQMAAILYGFAQTMDLDVGTMGDLSGFQDQGMVSDWARTPLGWAIGTGLLNGKSADTLDPSGKATRAEVSAILERFIQNVLLLYKEQEDDVQT